MNAMGILFFQAGATGWSEVYPMNVASYAAAATDLAGIATDRLALLVSDASLIGSRISDSDVKGDSYPTGIVPTVGTFATTPTDGTYYEGIALQNKVFGSTTKRSTRYLHALPKSQINSFGAYLPTAPFTTAYNTWVAKMIANVSIATKIKTAIVPPFYTFTPITAITEEGAVKRAIGRPFDLPRGRRLIA